MARSTVYISKKNLLHNLQVIKKNAPHSQIIAMVKGNAYGHGLELVGKILEHEVDILGVCSLEEALVLKKQGITTDILLTQGVYKQEEIPIAADLNIQIAFNNKTQLDWLENSTVSQPIKSWIKINTGLGRLGFEPEEAQDAYTILVNSSKTQKTVRIMSHFACAPNAEHTLNKEQITAFENFIHSFDTEYSLCNSAGILNFSDHHYDFVRPGICLYGISPFSSKTGSELGLKPVMTFKSHLISIQERKKNSYLGYNAEYQLPHVTRIGTVGCGFGDGYPLYPASGSYVLIQDKKCPIIGKISMDMITVDLTSCLEAQIGDTVTLWSEELPIETVCKSNVNSVWTLVTGIQKRVEYKVID